MELTSFVKTWRATRFAVFLVYSDLVVAEFVKNTLYSDMPKTERLRNAALQKPANFAVPPVLKAERGLLTRMAMSKTQNSVIEQTLPSL